MQFHGLANVQPFFKWADRYLSESLPPIGRPRNCFLAGVSSSGKSTLTDLVCYLIPGNRTFTPVCNSSTPYCKLRDHHAIATCDDWRFTTKVPVTETLQWMGGGPFSVDIKGKVPASIKQGPPLPLFN